MSDVAHDGHLDLGIVVIVTCLLVGDTLFSDLLVVIRGDRHVDRLRLAQFFHGCHGPLLTDVQRHLRNVLDFRLYKLLVVGWRRNQRHVHALNTRESQAQDRVSLDKSVS